MFIELPWFDPRLNAHNKGHWRAKSPVVKVARQTAKSEMCRLLGRERSSKKEPGWKPWNRAEMWYTFHMPDAIRRDVANMIQQTKPYIDGIIDAGLIVDDSWQHLRIAGVDVVVDRTRPRVELGFLAVDNFSKCQHDGCEVVT